MKKILTLGMVYNDERILLGRKKRGFGQGRGSGFGGKVKADEAISGAARPELDEEVRLAAKVIDQRAVLTCNFPAEPDELEVDVWAVTKRPGESQETEEMKPRWFKFNDIPDSKMWPAVRYWLLLFLLGDKLAGEFYFQDDDKLLSYKIKNIGHAPGKEK